MACAFLTLGHIQDGEHTGHGSGNAISACIMLFVLSGEPFISFMFVTRWSPSGTRYGCAQGQPQSHYSQPGTPGHRRCNSCKRPLHSLYNRCIAYAKHKTTAGRAFAQLNMCFASHWPCVSLCHLPSLAPVYTHDTQALSNPKPSPPPPPGLYARQWMESTWMQSKISI